MIKAMRDWFEDDISHFTDIELAYIIGYERIPMDQVFENDTLWKLRSWAKYEDYLDAAEQIFDEDDKCKVFTEEFYEQSFDDQIDQATEMIREAGYPTMVTDDYEVWVKRIDWK